MSKGKDPGKKKDSPSPSPSPSPAVEASGSVANLKKQSATRRAKVHGTVTHSTAEHAKEVGRSGHRAGKGGVEVAKSEHTSVHDMKMSDLFPGHKA